MEIKDLISNLYENGQIKMKKFFYLHVVSLFVLFLGCSTKNPVPSVDSAINLGCLFDNRKYCGWSTPDRFCLFFRT